MSISLDSLIEFEVSSKLIIDLPNHSIHNANSSKFYFLLFVLQL